MEDKNIIRVEGDNGPEVETITREEANQAEEVMVPREEVVAEMGDEAVAKIEDEAEEVKVEDEAQA